MSLNCRFSLCQWSGHEDEIFDHLECNHKKFLREPKGNIYFDLTLDDLQQEVLVLCSSNGLYWLRQNLRQPRSNGIDFGVFHIGASENVKYKLKLDDQGDGQCKYWGPFASTEDYMQHPNKEDYNLRFDYDFLESINETMPCPRLRLYFGEHDKSEDEIRPGSKKIQQSEEDELLDRLLLESFTCAVCFEYIRRDARFCENKHFICLNCFDEMLLRKKLKCPTCRGQYLYDCIDHNLERLLRIVKFPDVPTIDFPPQHS